MARSLAFSIGRSARRHDAFHAQRFVGSVGIIKLAANKLNIPCIPSRLAILTHPLNGRSACHYCAECGRSCGVNANFNSPGVHIFPVMKTDNLEVRTNAMVREAARRG